MAHEVDAYIKIQEFYLFFLLFTVDCELTPVLSLWDGIIYKYPCIRRENLCWIFILLARLVKKEQEFCCDWTVWMPQKNNLWPSVYNQKGLLVSLKCSEQKPLIKALFRVIWKLSSELLVSYINYHLYTILQLVKCFHVHCVVQLEGSSVGIQRTSISTREIRVFVKDTYILAYCV